MHRNLRGLETGSASETNSFNLRSSAFFLFSLLLFLLPSTAHSQVTLSAAVNGASYTNSTLPNGKLAQGVLFIAFGEGMGPATIERANKFPLPTNLAGTSIDVTVGGVTKPCIMLYSLAGQVAAILPSEVPTGDGTMVLTYNGISSAPLSITVVEHSFGAFAINQGGTGPGVFLDAFTNVANGLQTAANPNAQWDIWGTGLGAVNGDEDKEPLPGDIASADVHVFFGEVEAQVLYRGRSGCCAGVDQIRIVVPQQVAGCYVPVYVVVNGVISNFVTMSVAETGQTCSDPLGYDPETYQQLLTNGTLRLGAIGLSRFYVEGTGFAYQGDAATAGFSALALQNVGGAVPQPGACVVIQFPTPTVPIPAGLDAGNQIPMMSPMGDYNLVPPAFGGYSGQYGLAFSPSAGSTGIPGMITDGTVLEPGNYQFLVPGGADVGPVNVSLNLPTKFEWTGRVTAGSTISRNVKLDLTWANADPNGLVLANLQSQSSPGVGAAVNCWFDAASGKASIPAAVMSALPPSYLDGGESQGTISVYQFIRGDDFTATGIDIGVTQIGDGFNIGQIKYQ